MSHCIQYLDQAIKNQTEGLDFKEMAMKDSMFDVIRDTPEFKSFFMKNFEET